LPAAGAQAAIQLLPQLRTAGMQQGFVLAEPSLLNELNERLGPWAVSCP
jgi:hypothetical protein